MLIALRSVLATQVVPKKSVLPPVRLVNGGLSSCAPMQSAVDELEMAANAYLSSRYEEGRAAVARLEAGEKGVPTAQDSIARGNRCGMGWRFTGSQYLYHCCPSMSWVLPSL